MDSQPDRLQTTAFYAEELRTAIQGKAEQGQSSLGFLPSDEDKTS
jgi:hypothetical protein